MMGILSRGIYWVINDRYEVSKVTGVVWDMESTDDIPPSIYGIRDRLLKQLEEMAK